jgi:hypothetical protein
MKSKSSQIAWQKRQEAMDMTSNWEDPLEELMNRTSEIGEERFQREFMSTPPIEVSDGLRLEEMHKKILRLNDRIARYALDKIALEVHRDDALKANDILLVENKKLVEEIKELKIEIDKIYSRFDILDL